MLLIATLALVAAGGCSPRRRTAKQGDNGPKVSLYARPDLTPEEARRIDLYLTAMRAAFAIENGGAGFIAVRLDSLEGLSARGGEVVLEELGDLSANVYDFAKVKGDPSLFRLEKNGDLLATIGGTLLSVRLSEYKGDSAVIQGISWFGNLGAVLPKYKATYRDGAWSLELIAMVIS